MRVTSTIPRIWFRRRGNKSAVGDLNLLDWETRSSGRGGFTRWILLALLGLVHGGMLGYLIFFVRMPIESDAELRNAIRVDLSGRPALEKQDREPFRSKRDIRNVTDVAAESTPQALTRVAANGRQFPLGSTSSLPEDAGTPRQRLISIVAEELSPHTSSAVRGEQSASANADYESILPRRRLSPTSRASVAAEPLRRSSGAEQSPKTVLDSARLLTRYGDPELPEESWLHFSDRTSRIAMPGEAGSAQDIPLPGRRMIIAREFTFHEESSSKAADLDTKNHLLSAYREKVRAHLATYKPRGGFGSDTVVVSFTLSRKGDVASARVLKSQGIYHLEQGALNAVQRAAPYPEPPKDLQGSRFHFAIPFRFE